MIDASLRPPTLDEVFLRLTDRGDGRTSPPPKETAA